MQLMRGFGVAYGSTHEYMMMMMIIIIVIIIIIAIIIAAGTPARSLSALLIIGPWKV